MRACAKTFADFAYYRRRIATGAFPRETKLKPLVAEFATYHNAFCDPQGQSA